MLTFEFPEYESMLIIFFKQIIGLISFYRGDCSYGGTITSGGISILLEIREWWSNWNINVGSNFLYIVHHFTL
jgi:hypothetical protein